MDYPEVPPEIVEKVHAICVALPEAYEEPAWTGVRWRIRKRTFAHLLAVVDQRPAAHARAAGTDEPVVLITFRSEPPELDVLRELGHPFFKPGWGRNVVGMVIDDSTDWDELAELLLDSFCVMAPKKLAEGVTPRQ